MLGTSHWTCCTAPVLLTRGRCPEVWCSAAGSGEVPCWHGRFANRVAHIVIMQPSCACVACCLGSCSKHGCCAGQQQHSAASRHPTAPHCTLPLWLTPSKQDACPDSCDTAVVIWVRFFAQTALWELRQVPSNICFARLEDLLLPCYPCVC